MLSNNLQRNLILGLATLVLAAVPALANPILVNNFSFETLPVGGLPNGGCGTGCSYSMGAIPGWASTGVAGQFQPGTPVNSAYFTAISDGPTSAYESTTGGIISQTVTPTVVLGQVYTLMVDLGYRLDGSFTSSVDLLINGNHYTGTGVAPVKGRFSTFVATYIGAAPDVGKSITIELLADGSQANFDNVRLDSSAPGTFSASAPEPASFLLIGSALLAISYRRRSLVRK